MNKAELEHYLKKKYGDKIGPVNHEPRKKSTVFRSDGLMCDLSQRKHRNVHRMKNGTLKIREITGIIHYE
jgi:hypothetical protein